MEDDIVDSPRICYKDDYQTAIATNEVLKQHMFRVIKGLPAGGSKVVVDRTKEPILLKTFWNSLLEEFEAKDFKAVVQEVGLTIPTVELYIL